MCFCTWFEQSCDTEHNSLQEALWSDLLLTRPTSAAGQIEPNTDLFRAHTQRQTYQSALKFIAPQKLNQLCLHFLMSASHFLRPSAAPPPLFCPSVFCSNERLPCGRIAGWGLRHQVPFTATLEVCRNRWSSPRDETPTQHVWTCASPCKWAPDWPGFEICFHKSLFSHLLLPPRWQKSHLTASLRPKTGTSSHTASLYVQPMTRKQRRTWGEEAKIVKVRRTRNWQKWHARGNNDRMKVSGLKTNWGHPCCDCQCVFVCQDINPRGHVM